MTTENKDIIKKHLKDSYFAELFKNVYDYYNSNPLLSYKGHTEVIENYQSFDHHVNNVSYWENFKIAAMLLASIIGHFLTINLFCLVIGLYLIGAFGVFYIGNIIFVFKRLLYFGILKGGILYDLKYYISSYNIGSYLLNNVIFPLLTIFLPFIIIGVIAYFLYRSDKREQESHNRNIDEINRQKQQDNKKEYQKALYHQFLSIFEDNIAKDNKKYISNVIDQLKHYKEYFNHQADMDDTHSQFEKECLSFVKNQLNQIKTTNNSEVISCRLVLFARLYQIIEENHTESFSDIEKIYHEYEKNQKFLPILSIIYKMEYLPEYYPMIVYHLMLEKYYIVEAIHQQRGFVNNQNNIILEAYKQYQ